MKRLVVCGAVVLGASNCKPIESSQDANSEVKAAEVELHTPPIESCSSLVKAPATGAFSFQTNLPKSWDEAGKKVRQNVSSNVKKTLELLINPLEAVTKYPSIDFNHRLGMRLHHKGGLRNITRVYIGGRDQEDVNGLLDFIKVNRISCEDVLDEKRKLNFDIVGIKMNFPNSAAESYRSIHFHGQNTDYIVMELTGERMVVRASTRRWTNAFGWLAIVNVAKQLKELKDRARIVPTYDTYEISADGGIINHDRVIAGQDEATTLLRDGALVSN